jgi:WD40 repeat protein
MWDPRSGNLLSEHVLEGPPLALGDAGGRPVVFASDFDHSIHLWDVLTGQVMGVPLPGHEGLGTAAAIAVIDGKPILASGGSDNSVRILDARSGKLLREPLYGHKMPITAVAFGEIDGKPVVVSVDENNSMLIWDLIGSELPLTKPMISSGDQVAAVTLLDVDGAPLIAASSTDHTVRLWDGRNGDQLDQLMWADLNMHRAEHENTESQMKVYSHLARTAPGKARYWLCKAAENGHFQAQLELGQWYWRGPKGVPRDIRKAYVWYSLAAEQGGNAWDVWELRAIANQMTREQQAEAEQLLEGYQPGQCERDFDFSNP